MLTLTITDETLKTAFDTHIDKLFAVDNYSNPIKLILDNVFGYSGDAAVKAQIKQYVLDNVKVIISSPQFHLVLGQTLATMMAAEEIKKLKR